MSDLNKQIEKIKKQINLQTNTLKLIDDDSSTQQNKQWDNQLKT